MEGPGQTLGVGNEHRGKTCALGGVEVGKVSKRDRASLDRRQRRLEIVTDHRDKISLQSVGLLQDSSRGRLVAQFSAAPALKAHLSA